VLTSFIAFSVSERRRTSRIWGGTLALGWRVLALVAGMTLASAASAQGGEATVSPASDGDSWLVWHTDNFFTSCDGNCGAAFYGGREVTTNMTSVFLIEKPVAPYNWDFGGAGIVAGSFTRRYATLFNMLDLEVEIGIGQRIGDMHATEFWLAAGFRWTYFPWNKYVKTTIALEEGPDIATEIDQEERLRAGNDRGSYFLNFFTPEITFARPSDPNNELLLRFHHRSGIFGLINGVNGGSSFATIGFRHRF
jgi:hypothetical protein